VHAALPIEAEKVPARQFEQDADAALEKVPVAQATHALKEEFGTKPARQVLHAVAPVEETALLPHAVQKGLEEAAVKVPAAQFKQDGKPTVEYVPATQIEQLREPAVPVNVPAAQSAQVAAAGADANLPVGHNVHATTPTVAPLL
jgi:hypothetical protein